MSLASILDEGAVQEAAPALHAPALQATGIAKRFGALVAVAEADFTLARGEVHVLMGANGCGKSTLCKIVAGAVAADAGRLTLEGREVAHATPQEARRAGIATVYQETSLIPTLSVAENILLGIEPTRIGLVDRKGLLARARALIAGDLAGLAGGLDLDALAGDLSVDAQQTVEIVKALALDPAIVIFDEATASLHRHQVEAFFAVIRKLQARGTSIVFISHRLDEVFAIADRITVMRNGETVATLETGETDADEIVRLMIGQDATSEAGASDRAVGEAAPVLLDVEGLTAPGLAPTTLRLRAGEVLGLGGLQGQGQLALLHALYGLAPASAGRVTIGGARIARLAPAAAIRHGIGFVSGDRGRMGALAGRPILENLTVSEMARRGAALFPREALRRLVQPLVDKLSIRFAGYAAPLRSLSGGNQQKVILARALATNPRVLLLDDPTKGIDIAAKRDLYAFVRAMCEGGAAVLLHASEDAELLENASRVLVFNGGRVVDELAGERLSEFHLYQAALDAA